MAARVDHLDKDVAHVLRDDLVHLEVHNMPPFAEGNPAVFFTAAQTYERQQGQIAVEWKFSLPRELGREQQIEAASAFLQSQFGDRHPYVMAVHAPTAADGGENVHVHCLWSSRGRDDLDRSAATYFKRPNPTHPERGGPGKARDKYAFGSVKSERVLYSDVMNYSLERSGSEARLHPETVAARGLDRDPEPRVSISDSNKAKFDHIITPNWQKVLDHRAAREARKAGEQAHAHHYWEERKQQLGLTADIGRLVPSATMARHDALLDQAKDHGIPLPPVTAEPTRQHRRGVEKTPERHLPPQHSVGKAMHDLAAAMGQADEVSGAGVRLRLDKNNGRERGDDFGISF